MGGIDLNGDVGILDKFPAEVSGNPRCELDVHEPSGSGRSDQRL